MLLPTVWGTQYRNSVVFDTNTCVHASPTVMKLPASCPWASGASPQRQSVALLL